MLKRVWSSTVVGVSGVKVGVEVDVAGGLPKTVVVGLPDTAVQESKERVKAAVKNSGFAFPVRHITINLTPADLRKEGPIFDLPIAIAILAASEQVETTDLEDYLFLGELSLDGSLRSISGVLPMTVTAAKLGFKGVIVPQDNAQEAAVVENINVYGFSHINEVAEFLHKPSQYPPAKFVPQHNFDNYLSHTHNLKDVKGQNHARRALEIAATGGHNLLFHRTTRSGKNDAC